MLAGRLPLVASRRKARTTLFSPSVWGRDSGRVEVPALDDHRLRRGSWSCSLVRLLPVSGVIPVSGTLSQSRPVRQLIFDLVKAFSSRKVEHPLRRVRIGQP